MTDSNSDVEEAIKEIIFGVASDYKYLTYPELIEKHTQSIKSLISEQVQAEIIAELERLIKKQYFAEGYGYDHGQVIDVGEIEDRIKSLKAKERV